MAIVFVVPGASLLHKMNSYEFITKSAMGCHGSQTAPGKAFCTVLGPTQRGWVELGSDHGGQVLEDPSE